MPDDVYQRFMVAARDVSRKLYPLHGLKEKFEEIWAKERRFFEKYEGCISTQLGPQADMDELKKLAEKIKEAADEK